MRGARGHPLARSPRCRIHHHHHDPAPGRPRPAAEARACRRATRRPSRRRRGCRGRARAWTGGVGGMRRRSRARRASGSARARGAAAIAGPPAFSPRERGRRRGKRRRLAACSGWAREADGKAGRRVPTTMAAALPTLFKASATHPKTHDNGLLFRCARARRHRAGQGARVGAARRGRQHPRYAAGAGLGLGRRLPHMAHCTAAQRAAGWWRWRRRGRASAGVPACVVSARRPRPTPLHQSSTCGWASASAKLAKRTA